jgi:hypothetical protein
MATYILTSSQLNNRILNSFSIPSSGGSIDPDAQAFITAAGITNSTQQSAINTLVVSLKADNIWTKMKAIYPFVGGTATTHKYNLKDPRDLNAAFRLVFNGGWTHSANGIQGNGINNWINTWFNPLTQFNSNLFSAHVSAYSRTDASIEGDYDPDISDNASGRLYLVTFQDIGQDYVYAGFNASVQVNLDDFGFNTQGLFAVSMINDSSQSVYANSTEIYNDSGTYENYFISDLFTIGGSNAAALYSLKQYAFATIGTGLTDADVSNLYTAVQAFQTTLERQV